MITTLAILMNSIDRIILPTLLPAIVQDFNISEVQAGWINSLSFFFFGMLTGAVLFGLLSDYIGTGYRRC
nr:Kynurenine formamidase [Candidatus Pantoea persica]